MNEHDIYSYGVISSSTLYRLRHAFPSPEGYAEIEACDHMLGGEAANSSIVLARLGLRVKLDGSRIGDDEGGRRIRHLLAEHGIECAQSQVDADCRTVEEVVFAAGETRTIFGTYARMHEEMAWRPPDADDIRRARVLCLDPFFGEASVAAARIAAGAGVPAVTVDCRHDDPLLDHVDAIVVAESFIRENYGEEGLDELFDAYRRACKGLVVFTFGSRPLWHAAADEPRREFEAFDIEPVDTAGGGDAFRAGIVFGILNGWEPARSVEFAAAVAAIVCTRSPGVLDAPSLGEVLDFLGKGRTRSE